MYVDSTEIVLTDENVTAHLLKMGSGFDYGEGLLKKSKTTNIFVILGHKHYKILR